MDVSDHIGHAYGEFDYWMAISQGFGQMQRFLALMTPAFGFPASVIALAREVKKYLNFDFPSLARPECAVRPTLARGYIAVCMSLSFSPSLTLCLTSQIKLEPAQKAVLRIGSVAAMLPVIVFLIGFELSVGKCMRHHGGGMPLVHVLWSITIAMHQILFMTITRSMLGVFDCVAADDPEAESSVMEKCECAPLR